MSPSLLLSLILAGLCAAVAHLFWGKRLWELPIFWLLGLAGFWLGQLAASFLQTRLLMVGPLHPLEGIMGALGVIFLGKWLRL